MKHREGRETPMLGLYDECLLRIDFINEKSVGAEPQRLMADRANSKIEETSQISEESQSNHRTLPWLLGRLAARFPV